jgi:uncharacterized protein with FMN-binding domain
MAGFVRRVTPAAALGGLAVFIVAFLDPIFGSKGETASTGTGEAKTAPISCDTVEQVMGPSVTTRWGPVQVQAKVAGGKLCSVIAVVWPDGDRTSAKISDRAIPILDAAAIQEGTAFDSVSGATYTSEGYRGSLQQLLDSL